MPKYRLKAGQETFQVVDGPDAGNTFERGREYDVLPRGEERRFEKVLPAKAKAAAKPEIKKPTKAKE